MHFSNDGREKKKKINGTGCHPITMDLNQYAVGRHDLHTFNTERLSFQLKVSTSCCRMPIQWTRSLPPKPHPPIPTIAKGLILTASQSNHLIFTAEYAGWKTKRPIWLALPRLERVGSKVKSCNAHYKEKLHTHANSGDATHLHSPIIENFGWGSWKPNYPS